MADKAYIVVNKQQERIILEKLEREGYVWRGLNTKPTTQPRLIDKPIPIFARDDKRLTFDYKVKEAYLADYEIVFDGRKEEQMSEKYVVSQEFMNELKDWKECLMSYGEAGYFVGHRDINGLPICVANWWGYEISNEENNNRLIAIIRWVNGEDVFEVEKPKKWVVRSKDRTEQGSYLYIYLIDSNGVKDIMTTWTKDIATKFDTKEEAESWANSHQEVRELIEVKE